MSVYCLRRARSNAVRSSNRWVRKRIHSVHADGAARGVLHSRGAARGHIARVDKFAKAFGAPRKASRDARFAPRAETRESCGSPRRRFLGATQATCRGTECAAAESPQHNHRQLRVQNRVHRWHFFYRNAMCDACAELKSTKRAFNQLRSRTRGDNHRGAPLRLGSRRPLKMLRAGVA